MGWGRAKVFAEPAGQQRTEGMCLMLLFHRRGVIFPSQIQNTNQRRCTDATHFILSPSIISRNKKRVIWSGEVQDCSRFCGDDGWHGFCFSSRSHTWKWSCRRAWGGWGLKILQASQWQEHWAQTKNKTSHALSNLTCLECVSSESVRNTVTQNLHPEFVCVRSWCRRLLWSLLKLHRHWWGTRI